MRSEFVVVERIRLERPAQVGLTEHDNVIEAFSTNGADEPFNVTVLPW